jgi:hypothetical protein
MVIRIRNLWYCLDCRISQHHFTTDKSPPETDKSITGFVMGFLFPYHRDHRSMCNKLYSLVRLHEIIQILIAMQWE